MWTAAWTNHAFPTILAVVEEVPFRQVRNTSSPIQCDRYFKLDVSHGLHSCYRLGGKLAYTHHIPSCWLTIFLSCWRGSWTRMIIYIQNSGSSDSFGDIVRSLKYILSLDCDTRDASEITKHWISKVDQVMFSCRRPRWLGRLSSCLLKSISRVQFSPSAHTRRDFSLHKKMIRGRRESVS